MIKQLTSPVLFMVFNRPDTTRQVFQKIRETRPIKLYIAADGPRDHIETEYQKTQAVREICNQVDWKCEVFTLYRDKNLGCGRAVSEAISWFFEHEEEGIILEDDCLPDDSFFEYCSVLLQRYREDVQVMHISGSNFQFGILRGDGDYYFSALSHVWGWATWRRAWQSYQFDLAGSKMIGEQQYELYFNQNQTVINFYKEIFTIMRNAAIDTWDYQWLHAIILNNGLSVCPNINLVRNLGFREDATHTLHQTSWNVLNVDKSLRSFNSPSLKKIDYSADEYTLKNVIGIMQEPNTKSSFSQRLIPILKSFARRLSSNIKK